MILKIEQGKLSSVDIHILEKKCDVIGIFTHSEWSSIPNIQETLQLSQFTDFINTSFFSRIESNEQTLFSSIAIPPRQKEGKTIHFLLFIIKCNIIFIDDSGFIKTMFLHFMEKKQKNYTLEKIFHEFLISLIKDDFIFLQELEHHMVEMEEKIFNKQIINFNHKMLNIKKIISKTNRYYEQLINLVSMLVENEIEFLTHDATPIFNSFINRVERLQTEAKALRDYANQIQEVHQAEIGIRQNSIMKILTIITAIFLPLTLLVGWYGMNFKYMPELTWTKGYLYVIILSVIIIIVSLWIFKKKKFW